MSRRSCRRTEADAGVAEVDGAEAGCGNDKGCSNCRADACMGSSALPCGGKQLAVGARAACDGPAGEPTDETDCERALGTSHFCPNLSVRTGPAVEKTITWYLRTGVKRNCPATHTAQKQPGKPAGRGASTSCR